MQTVKISKANALKAYKKADKQGKQMLSELLEGEVNFSGKVTDQVKTFEDALEIVGVKDEDNISKMFIYNGINKDMIALQAHAKLIIIARALNNGWVPDWNNSSQYKYYPYFNMQSGFGFSNTGYVWASTHSTGGSRLCFETEELAEYAGKQFTSIYKDLLT